MKSRLAVLSMLVCFLLLAGTLLAQEKGQPQGKKKSSMMMMQSEGMAPPHMQMMERAWHMGATSMVLSEMLQEAGELLQAGNLKAADQKALAGVFDQLADLIPQLYYPGTMKSEQIKGIKKKMDELGTELEKIGKQTKGK
jgi:hypothetical protein